MGDLQSIPRRVDVHLSSSYSFSSKKENRDRVPRTKTLTFLGIHRKEDAISHIQDCRTRKGHPRLDLLAKEEESPCRIGRIRIRKGQSSKVGEIRAAISEADTASYIPVAYRA